MRRVFSIGRGRHGSAGTAAGFTLVEVVAVLLVIGVMTLLVFRSSVSSNAGLVAETEQLRSHLRFAQSLALANNMDSWAIALSASGYSLRKNGASATTDLPGVGAVSHVFRSGVSVIDGSGVITFDEWGSPGDASLTITLSDGTHSSTITLNAQTGYLS